MREPREERYIFLVVFVFISSHLYRGRVVSHFAMIGFRTDSENTTRRIYVDNIARFKGPRKESFGRILAVDLHVIIMIIICSLLRAFVQRLKNTLPAIQFITVGTVAVVEPDLKPSRK